jgi:hypothetical protein
LAGALRHSLQYIKVEDRSLHSGFRLRAPARQSLAQARKRLQVAM